MFVEREQGRARVWILPSSDRDGGEALEFFSGASERIAEVRIDDARRVVGFVATDGRAHLASAGSRAYDANDPAANEGARYFGGGGYFVDFFQSPMLVRDVGGACDLELQPIRVMRESAAGKIDERATRNRIVMYREPPSADCPNGRWVSWPRSALDLGDRTMLLTMPSRVVRLRMSDLSPVGSAPRIHVVDVETIEAYFGAVESRGGMKDPNGYLGRKLGDGERARE